MRSGFTLIELLIVVAVIATVAGLALPNLVAAKVSSNESATIAAVRTLCTVSEQYRGRFGSFPGATSGSGLADLADLALRPEPFIDPELGTGRKGGYLFSYVSAATSWRVTADPADPNAGVRSFYCDHTGVIRSEADFLTNGSATAASPAID